MKKQIKPVHIAFLAGLGLFCIGIVSLVIWMTLDESKNKNKNKKKKNNNNKQKSIVSSSQSSITSIGGTISGVSIIYDEPMINANIRVDLQDLKQEQDKVIEPFFKETKTDSKGFYKLENLIPGTYSVSFDSEEFSSITTGRQVLENKVTEVNFILYKNKEYQKQILIEPRVQELSDQDETQETDQDQEEIQQD